MDSAITRFELTGNLYIWKFQSNNRNYPGWNLNADSEGCDSLLNLLDLMSKSQFSSQKTLNTSLPSDKIVSAVNAGIAFKTKQQVTLKFKKEASDIWHINDNESDLLVQFSGQYMDEFKTSLFKIKSGNGDFAMSDNLDENILYFWWLLK